MNKIHKISKRLHDVSFPSLKRHVRSNIQEVLRSMDPFVQQKDLDDAKLEYIGLLQEESLLKEEYPLQYQEILLSGIVETQRSPRRSHDDTGKSPLRDLIVKATKEPSISRYTSGTALYEFNSLKKSETTLMRMQGHVSYNPDYKPKTQTVMKVSPRGKRYDTKPSKARKDSKASTSADELENALRTVEYQQSRIDQLTKRLVQSEFDEDVDGTAMELANRLQALYKEEWREAYHEMNTWFKNKEAEIIYNLFRIIRFAYEFCRHFAQQQISELTKSSTKPIMQPIKLPYMESQPTVQQQAIMSSTGTKYAKKYRRDVAKVSLPQVIGKFKALIIEPDFGWDPDKLPRCISTYIDKAVEIIWMMCVQDPPMVLDWPPDGSVADADKYMFYGGDGVRVKQCVWPCVMVSRNGPVLTRGMVVVAKK